MENTGYPHSSFGRELLNKSMKFKIIGNTFCYEGKVIKSIPDLEGWNCLYLEIELIDSNRVLTVNSTQLAYFELL